MISYKMLTLHLLYLTLWSAQAAYISRMTLNRVRPTPNAFRPGVMLRPWHPRLVQGSNRPYVIYRTNPQRYAMRHFSPAIRSTQPWRSTVHAQTPRLPTAGHEYQFVRAASAPSPAQADGGRGAIHTVPAPNLSLAEKPIVVMDADNSLNSGLDATKQKYDVTEKFQDPVFQVPPAKIEQPIGFSKTTTITTPELQAIVGSVGNSASVQVTSALPPVTQANIQQAFSHQPVVHPIVHPQIHQVPQSLIPQQFNVQTFNGLTNPQELIQANSEGLIISPSALYQPDPAFLQKLQQQLLQRFPGIEFVPYVAEVQAAPSQQVHVIAHPHPNQVHHYVQQQQPPLLQYQPQPQSLHIQEQPQQTQDHQIQNHHVQQDQIQQEQSQEQSQEQQIQAQQDQLQILPLQTQQQIHPQQFQPHQNQPPPPHPALQQLLQPQSSQAQQQQTVQPETIQDSAESIKPQAFALNHGVTKQTPSSFVLSGENPRNFVQRETQEGVVTLLHPQVLNNVTENLEVTPLQPQNVTIEKNATETNNSIPTSTVKSDVTTEGQKVSPVYYAQIGQSLGGVITSGFYSAVNDVRAAASLQQVEKPQENVTTTQENVTTTTISPELQPYFVQKTEKDDKNQTVTEMKPVLGTPFAKPPDSINVAYTLVRTDDKETKVAKDGSVYAGQIVEATISEDHDFNKQQANLISRRPPLRLVAVADKKEVTTTTKAPQKMAMVKARIPPRSKLTFDDKTGEPVLRIYASYIDTPMQKQMLASRLSNTKYGRDSARKQNTTETVKTSAFNATDKTQGFDGNQVSQFGLKLRSRSDDYLQLFDEYDDSSAMKMTK